MHNQKKQQSGRKKHPKIRKPQEQTRIYQEAFELYHSGQFQEAELLLQPHINRHPEDANAVNLAGLIAYQFGQYDSAIRLFQSVILLNDREDNIHNNMGAALKESGDLKGAIPFFQKAVELNQNNNEASYNLGGSYQALGELNLAIKWYEFTLSHNPEYLIAYTNLVGIYKDQGQIEKAVDGFRQTALRDPSNAVANSNLLFCLNYLENTCPDAVFRDHQEWARRHAPEDSWDIQSFPGDAIPNRRIRVGYVSADFRVHSVAFFIHPIIQGHNREQFEVFCYADVGKPDEVTQVMMKTADHWQNIFQMSDDQVFQWIQRDQIDILVDLAGHSGSNRMKLFACKPAPVQVAYLGYPNTTGLSAMDYRITDATADPPGLTDSYYTEELIRLPGGFLCYHPSLGSPDVSDPPCLKNGYITFGSFNNRAKINSKVIALWSDLLKHVNNSRLILKSSIASDQDAKQQLLSLFVQNGIDDSRIEIMSFLPFGEHLKQYLRVDIALDTFPYNGTTTTFEALWMGVPVITLAGDTHASRVGASILSQVGLDAWVISSVGDYLNNSQSLANDIDSLKSLRMSLRQRLQNSSLMDNNGFVLKLETAYRRIWRNWCAKRIAEGSDNRDVINTLIEGDTTVCVPSFSQCPPSYILQESPDWFEQEIAFVRSVLKPGMNVMDIGANYGAHTLAAAKVVGSSGKILAFESDQLMSAYLSRSIRLNKLEHITLIQAEVLDDGLKSYACKPDFLRMNTEGQGDNIVKSCKHILTMYSPLILYEIKHGNTSDFEALDALLKMGYESFRLIPGLGVLAPFLIGRRLDVCQLNLFQCRDDCAQTLAKRGLLVFRNKTEFSVAAVPPALWIDHLQGFPYILPFLSLWQTYCQKHFDNPDWRIHQQALSIYAVSKLPGYSASDRYWALKESYGLMMDLLQRHATVSRKLTAIRIAMDLGYQEDALRLLTQMLEVFESGREFSLDEPFLSVSAQMATVDPSSDVGQWLVYAVLETREICQAFSSYFTGKSSLENLEFMSTSPFYSDKMERRRQLIRKRFGIVD
jgi:predicted O-linked N-acetylglucosamine transferase (SPINDLY family)/precorrin-6B methylase 2